MVILPAKFSKLLKAWSSLAYSTGSSFTNSSPGSIQDKNTSNGTTINHEKCTSNMMQNMAWYARYDMQRICVLHNGKNYQGINLANQVCRWKDEMISVKIDIKISRNRGTVCKWQAKQEWHNSAINSTMLLSMQQETMLQHPNIATKHMVVIYKRCLTKYEHWATTRSHNSRFKQAWQKCKR